MSVTAIPEPKVDFGADEQAKGKDLIYLYMREPQVFPERADRVPLNERGSRTYDGIAFFCVTVERAQEIVDEIQAKIDERRGNA